MKQIGLFLIFGIGICNCANAQVIPFGNSQDSVAVYDEYKLWTYTSEFDLYYYKPITYDSINSPILLAIHGLGADGSSPRASLTAIADRQNALIVAPTMKNAWMYGYASYLDSNNCVYFTWFPSLMKQMYRHVLNRENRDTVPVHMIGFSAGGQFVSRYMHIRQGLPDSIPIKMAVSTNPFFYTFCTDSLNGVRMDWYCGIADPLPSWLGWAYNDIGCIDNWSRDVFDFFCNQHVKQYYNENYGVLIGTLNTASSLGFCQGVDGANRYERAQNFYAFSDTNAIARGTTLLWQYGEVPGVAHNQNLMYNTILAGDSIPLAERLLFETPWHPVPVFVPVANFNAADTGLTVNFTDATLNAPGYWYWDFGDGDTSLLQNPVHTYSSSGIYYVCLTAGDSCVTDSYCDSVAIIAVGIDDAFITENINLYPNPNNGSFIIELIDIENTIIEVYNIAGQLILRKSLVENTTKIDLTKHSKGMYFVKLETENKTTIKKIIYH